MDTTQKHLSTYIHIAYGTFLPAYIHSLWYISTYILLLIVYGTYLHSSWYAMVLIQLDLFVCLFVCFKINTDHSIKDTSIQSSSYFNVQPDSLQLGQDIKFLSIV